MTVRYVIRPKRYRDVDGFQIFDSPRQGWGTKIWVETREEAERVRDNLKAGRPCFEGVYP